MEWSLTEPSPALPRGGAPKSEFPGWGADAVPDSLPAHDHAVAEAPAWSMPGGNPGEEMAPDWMNSSKGDCGCGGKCGGKGGCGGSDCGCGGARVGCKQSRSCEPGSGSNGRPWGYESFAGGAANAVPQDPVPGRPEWQDPVHLSCCCALVPNPIAGKRLPEVLCGYDMGGGFIRRSSPPFITNIGTFRCTHSWSDCDYLADPTHVCPAPVRGAWKACEAAFKKYQAAHEKARNTSVGHDARLECESAARSARRACDWYAAERRGAMNRWPVGPEAEARMLKECPEAPIIADCPGPSWGPHELSCSNGDQEKSIHIPPMADQRVVGTAPYEWMAEIDMQDQCELLRDWWIGLFTSGVTCDGECTVTVSGLFGESKERRACSRSIEAPEVVASSHSDWTNFDAWMPLPTLQPTHMRRRGIRVDLDPSNGMIGEWQAFGSCDVSGGEATVKCSCPEE